MVLLRDLRFSSCSVAEVYSVSLTVFAEKIRAEIPLPAPRTRLVCFFGIFISIWFSNDFIDAVEGHLDDYYGSVDYALGTILRTHGIQIFSDSHGKVL